jgi:hypothetical protein
MTLRYNLFCTWLLVAAVPTLAWGAAPVPARARSGPTDKGTFLGVLCGPLPAANNLANRTPVNDPAEKPKPFRKAPQGVLVTHVLPDSPAARVDLRRGDVLLEYDRQVIRDGDHLAQLIQTDKPSRKVQVVYRRGENVRTAEPTLALGPPLKRAAERQFGTLTTGAPTEGAVSVWAAPLESGKMKVTIEYYSTGKLKTLTCEGAAAELASTVQKLPERERNLVRIALQRLHSLNSAPTAKR